VWESACRARVNAKERHSKEDAIQTCWTTVEISKDTFPSTILLLSHVRVLPCPTYLPGDEVDSDFLVTAPKANKKVILSRAMKDPLTINLVPLLLVPVDR
jgi:hypothetical protein